MSQHPITDNGEAAALPRCDRVQDGGAEAGDAEKEDGQANEIVA